jgi:hypothetical protein
MDSPRDKQLEKSLREMTEASVITEKESKSYLAKMQVFYKEKAASQNAPRLYIDSTTSQQTESKVADPDQLDF